MKCVIAFCVLLVVVLQGEAKRAKIFLKEIYNDETTCNYKYKVRDKYSYYHSETTALKELKKEPNLDKIKEIIKSQETAHKGFIESETARLPKDPPVGVRPVYTGKRFRTMLNVYFWSCAEETTKENMIKCLKRALEKVRLEDSVLMLFPDKIKNGLQDYEYLQLQSMLPLFGYASFLKVLAGMSLEALGNPPKPSLKSEIDKLVTYAVDTSAKLGERSHEVCKKTLRCGDVSNNKGQCTCVVDNWHYGPLTKNTVAKCVVDFEISDERKHGFGEHVIYTDTREQGAQDLTKAFILKLAGYQDDRNRAFWGVTIKMSLDDYKRISE